MSGVILLKYVDFFADLGSLVNPSSTVSIGKNVSLLIVACFLILTFSLLFYNVKKLKFCVLWTVFENAKNILSY